MENFKEVADSWGFGIAIIFSLAWVVRSLFLIILGQFQKKDEKNETLSNDYLAYAKEREEKAEKREVRLMQVISDNMQVNKELFTVLKDLRNQINN